MAAPINNNGNHQPAFLFLKRLSYTDTTTRLSWPSRHLDALIEATGRAGINLNVTPGYGVPFQVLDPNNQVWHLVCFTRQTGCYLKPVVSGMRTSLQKILQQQNMKVTATKSFASDIIYKYKLTFTTNM
uniref:Uncharacterized protein n=1 Tax=Opuntia streptacantha TaxID=393608 RepID=A0A7C9CPQ5_OPUST